jgi:hypothetical protein
VAIAIVQKKNTTTAMTLGSLVSSVEAVFDSPTTTGNRLICMCTLYHDTAANTPITFTDDGGHDWTTIAEIQNTGGSGLLRCAIGYSEPITGQSAHGVQANAGTNSYLGIGIFEMSGMGAHLAHAAAEGSGTSVSSGSISPSGSGLFYCGLCYLDDADTSLASSGPWASSTIAWEGSFGELNRLLDSSGSLAATWSKTNSNFWVAGIAAFGPESVPPHDGVAPWSSIWRSGRV